MTPATVQPKKKSVVKPASSMVRIHEEQYDKFALIIDVDYQSEEFNLFIQTEIIEKRYDSRYWLKHLRDVYAKVFIKIYILFIFFYI